MKILVQLLTIGSLEFLGGLAGILSISRWQWLSTRIRRIYGWIGLIVVFLVTSVIIAATHTHSPLVLPFYFCAGLFIGCGLGVLHIVFPKAFHLRSRAGGFITPFLFCAVLVGSALDQIDHAAENELTFVTQLSPRLLCLLGSLEALLIVGAFFWLRSAVRHFYACIEIAVGIVGIVGSFSRMPIDRLDLAYSLAIVSSIYIIIRGLDNLARYREASLLSGPSSPNAPKKIALE